MIQVQNITKTYVTGDLTQVALNNVSIDFRENEFVAILGPSGSGKTTLLNIIGGLDRYDSGDVVINNVSTKEYTDRNWDIYRNHTVGFIFQNYNLISQLSCKDNILLPAVYKRKKIEDKELERLAELLNITKLLDQRVNVLSGGEKQRVAIARSLILDPCLLIADEPTGNLDEKNRKIICNLLDEENKKGRGIILITHDDEMAVSAKTMLRLEKGVLV